MKKLVIDWDELSLAFDDSFWGASHYLDTGTGQVLTVTEEANQQLEQIYEEFYDPEEPDAFDLEVALTQIDLPDWQKESVKTADFVEQHYGSRVIAVPDTPSYEGYNEMQNFIATYWTKYASLSRRPATPPASLASPSSVR